MSATHPAPRPRRSALFMPGANARALAKARTLDADVVIMDLEDAVAPAAKEKARANVAEALAVGGYEGREVVVRVNHLESPWFAEDAAMTARAPVDAVLVPKVERPAEIHAYLDTLDAAGGPPDLKLWIMIETPRGVLECGAICAAHPRLDCLVAGTSDLAKALRARHTPERAGLVGALSQCVLAARAAGIDALDGVQLDLDDEAALEAACAQGRTLGFDGKTLIHPRQIAASHAAFGPTPAEEEAARAIVGAYAEAQAAGAGVVVVDGRLVEALHVEEAERTLALATAISVRAARR